jgi:Flp pilus assembly secretin CpaC
MTHRPALRSPALRSTVLIALAALAVAGSSAAFAQSAAPLSVGIDRSQRISLRGSVSSVVVANPQIADVTVIDANTLVIQGKGYGQTEILAVDAIGRTLFQNQIIVSGGQAGSMRVWRGGKATEMACASTCSPSLRVYENPGAGAATPTP